jgi:DNA-binding PadR family transcriptional regulator
MPKINLIEQHILLAVQRLQPRAHRVSIRDEIKRCHGPEYSFGALYSALQRLEWQGFLISNLGWAAQGGSGRRQLHFQLTARGQVTLGESLRALDAMRQGTPWQQAIFERAQWLH